jgi:hypothetical protein
VRSGIATFAIFASTNLFSQQSPPRDRAEQENESNRKQAAADSSPASPPIPATPKTGRINEPTPTPETQIADKEPQSICQKAFAPESWPTWALVVVGIVGTFLALRTLRAIKRQAELTRASLILTQRPRIIIRNIALDDPRLLVEVPRHGTDSVTISGTFYVSNIGGTPGTITENHSEILVFERPAALPMKRPYEGKTGGRVSITLTSGQSAPITFPAEGRELTRLERISIEHGTMTLHIIGWVAYADDMGNERRTAFCRRWDYILQRFIAINDDPDYEHAE